ncbi:hypothetical protein [Pontibacter ruber]|uniref:Uncharacterized protein n=1 Tax=Pontibacter ruber TaxID=1343895 RepID=A0ABW5D0Y9_9BACT|nr:hypothetical protein [Pontibacter ruber]
MVNEVNPTDAGSGKISSLVKSSANKKLLSIVLFVYLEIFGFENTDVGRIVPVFQPVSLFGLIPIALLCLAPVMRYSQEELNSTKLVCAANRKDENKRQNSVVVNFIITKTIIHCYKFLGQD